MFLLEVSIGWAGAGVAKLTEGFFTCPRSSLEKDLKNELRPFKSYAWQLSSGTQEGRGFSEGGGHERLLDGNSGGVGALGKRVLRRKWEVVRVLAVGM